MASPPADPTLIVRHAPDRRPGYPRDLDPTIFLASTAGLGVAKCNQLTTRCMPVLVLPDAPTTVLGAWGPMIARYTFVTVPGAGPTVIWSWTFGDTDPALEGNRALIDSLRFATD